MPSFDSIRRESRAAVTLLGMRLLSFAVLMALPLLAGEPLAKRISHTDPAKYRPVKAVHGGPGQLDYMAILDAHSLDTNLFFLHRGILQPKSGIGAHFHNQCEEMFVIFDGEAQFTIDGRTSVLKGPAGRLYAWDTRMPFTTTRTNRCSG